MSTEPTPIPIGSKEIVIKTLNQIISDGVNLKDLPFVIEGDKDLAIEQLKNWDKNINKIIPTLFKGHYYVNRYVNMVGSDYFKYSKSASAWRTFQTFRSEIDQRINFLDRIQNKLQPSKKIESNKKLTKHKDATNEIFIVHGHDNDVQQSVARFVEKTPYKVVILHEQANAGRTVIEKLEQESKNARFAIILLTPDDVGHVKDKPETVQPRARQNVVLELGYFIAKLGRNNVCALYKEGVEIPSDYDGVLYVKFDESDDWKIKLAKEMKRAELNIDLNKIFEI